MRRHTTAAGLGLIAGLGVIIVLASGLSGCCSAASCPPRDEPVGAGVSTENGSDRPSRPVFSPGAGYARDDGLAAQLGSDSFWNATTEAGGRVVLSEAVKNGDVPSQLGSYVGYVDRVFTQRITDRRVHILELDGENPGLRLLGEHGVPWMAIAYTRDEHIDESVRGASCDSAALIMDFGTAYWTLSWNATRGTLGERAREMDAFLESMTIGPRQP